MAKFASLVPENITLSCPIDYPYGLSDTKVRQHQTLSVIRRGATCVDLIVNPVYLINDKRQYLVDDIEANRTICYENNVQFRLVLEYRHFDKDTYYRLVNICKLMKLLYFLPSTGHFVDDYNDNLITCKLIKTQHPKAKIITNGNIWTPEQLEIVEKSGLYGVRLRDNYALSLLSQKT